MYLLSEICDKLKPDLYLIRDYDDDDDDDDGVQP